MTLTLDTGTPLRTLARYRELVQAILDAPASTQETDFLEWKTEVDMAVKRWQAQFGRHTIGFANREPEAAARWFGGCAYLVAGVSPGSLIGTSVYDTAKIEAWLAAYVGPAPDAPEWQPTYVELHGKQVLIFTIEAPEPGDPMWVCHQQFSENQRGRDKLITRKGGIYVRHKASTNEAGPADIAMLSRRLTATGRRVSGLSLLLAPGTTAQGVDFGNDKLDAWAKAERRALQPPPAGPVAGSGPQHPKAASRELTGADVLDQVARMAEMTEATASLFYQRDDRTRDEYQAEVEKYLTKARKRLLAVLVRRCYDRDLGRIRLAVRNDTDDPVQDVRIELTIRVKAARAVYADDIPDVELPSRPVMLGKLVRDRFAVLGNLAMPAPYLGVRSFDPPIPHGMSRRIEIENTNSAHITFDVGDLYPRETSRLDEFFLFAHYAFDPEPLPAIAAEWTAVTRNLTGVQLGSIEIPVAPDVPSLDALLTDRPANNDGGNDDELNDLDN